VIRQYLTDEEKQLAFEQADAIIERCSMRRLTTVPLLYAQELPEIAGVYMAATDGGAVLYVGKSGNIAKRCNLATHHKLRQAIEQGATVLYLAEIDIALAWFVEQRLIAHLRPKLNAALSLWWEKSAVPRAKKQAPPRIKQLQPSPSRLISSPPKKSGAAKKPEGARRVTAGWSVLPALIQRVRDQASQEGISPSAWVSRQLTMLLDRMDKIENTQIGDSDGN
jgi:hypothetical protein